MRRWQLLAGGALALSSAWAWAQEAPESLLPPGFDQPAQTPPRPDPAPAPARGSAPAASRPAAAGAPAPRAASSPVVQPLPAESGAAPEAAAAAPMPLASYAPGQLPPLEVLETLSPAQLDEVFGLTPRYDIPPEARRSPLAAGILDESEGGFALASLANQDASLVRAAIAGNGGVLVSRWGHILLRRALASRLAPPRDMDPADFAALRAALLLRMGEAEAARALVQDIDTGNYTPALTDAALGAYLGTADFTGICPAMATQGGTRDDAQWQVAGMICTAFQGDPGGALSRLDRALNRGLMPRIDLLLAQKYVGAAGKGRRAVTIEWDDVDQITPWRYGLALAVGLEPPARLMNDASPRYAYLAATAPMLGLTSRAAAADSAAGVGVLSSEAMVDLYGQIYAAEDITGDWSDRAGKLRDAYTAATLPARLAAMQSLWNGASDPGARYSRLVLTAYAAARLPPQPAFGDAAGDLIASMLAAGLDANAQRWSGVAGRGNLAWAELALGSPDGSGGVDSGSIDSFVSADRSPGQRKSAFLVAGLAGLGRISQGRAQDVAGRLGTTLEGQTRWIRIIDRAAALDNPELVALLVGVGMQARSWDKMTPRFLFHIVSALRQVGLEPEARMIAAEAVARG